MSTLLSIENLTMQFGGLKAVNDVSFTIETGSITGLIGPNGAGKTTLFNMLTGVYEPTSGSVVFEGKTLNGIKPSLITAHGIARTFQNIRLFKDLSVLDNLRIGCDIRAKDSLFSTLLGLPSCEESEEEIFQKALKLCDLFKLTQRKDELAKNLPYGDQRRLEIARALATGAKLILLDEPAAGMNNQETHDLMHFIRRLRDEFKITVLLIEHDMKLVMGISEKIVVLDHGVKIAEGNAQEIQKHPKVIEAYLGKASDQKSTGDLDDESL